MILLELFILLELIRLFRHSLYYAHFVRGKYNFFYQ